jgi:hypothetical protein
VDPDETAARSLRARVAIHTRWAKEPDRTAATAPARKAFQDRFEREVDPEGILDPVERAKRAENAKTAFYVRIALKSVEARRRKMKSQ